MKKLTLIRHAHAAQGFPDIDRRLSQRGVTQARWLGAELRDKGFSFSTLFSSGAQRALETAKYLCEELGQPSGRIKADAALYSFDMADLYCYIGLISEQINHAVIVAHNPAIHWLAQDLTGTTVDKVPTCTFLHLELNIEYWLETGTGCGNLLDCYYPPKL